MRANQGVLICSMDWRPSGNRRLRAGSDPSALLECAAYLALPFDVETGRRPGVREAELSAHLCDGRHAPRWPATCGWPEKALDDIARAISSSAEICSIAPMMTPGSNPADQRDSSPKRQGRCLDIHIETLMKTRRLVRMRVDGVLTREAAPWPPHVDRFDRQPASG